MKNETKVTLSVVSRTKVEAEFDIDLGCGYRYLVLTTTCKGRKPVKVVLYAPDARRLAEFIQSHFGT